ncbi:MAG: UMP kinase [Candidatus Jorgensenbacteria bacterium]
MKKTIVIALGGSVVFPDHIDWGFLRQFRSFVLRQIKKGRKFVIVVGGGRLSRMYVEAAAKVTTVKNEDKDWLGIHATRSNAHLLRTIFRDIADPVVIDGRHRIGKLRFPVTIASGWRPGWSTDYVASVLAHDFGVEEFVIVGKPDGVYTKDFMKHDDAEHIPEITWRRYRKLIPAKWKPSSHAPVDPVAARFAEKNKLVSVVLSGKDLKNLEALLNNKDFKGTIIK